MKGVSSRRKFLAFFVFSVILCLAATSGSFAQVGDPGGDSDVPITGIEWLLLGGGALGARKIYLKFRSRG